MDRRDSQELSIISPCKQLGPLDGMVGQPPALSGLSGTKDEQETTARKRETEQLRILPSAACGGCEGVGFAQLGFAGIGEPFDEADQTDVEGPSNELEFQKIQAAFARFVLA